MEIINLVNLSTPLWVIVKIAAIFGLIIYVIFAFVVLKQVNLMIETLEIDFERPIKIFATVHFAFALFVLLFAFFV